MEISEVPRDRAGELHEMALKLDEALHALKSNGENPTAEDVRLMVLVAFGQDPRLIGRGYFKYVYELPSDPRLVLKVARLNRRKKSGLRLEEQAANRFVAAGHGEHLAETFWWTEFCQLQERCHPAAVPQKTLDDLKQLILTEGNSRSLVDVNRSNIMRDDNGNFRLIDVSTSWFRSGVRHEDRNSRNHQGKAVRSQPGHRGNLQEATGQRRSGAEP